MPNALISRTSKKYRALCESNYANWPSTNSWFC